MQNFEEILLRKYCEEGHLLLPIFDPMKNQENKNIKI
jgi:hypothetical protein